MSCNFTCSSIGEERVLRFRCSGCKAGASIEQSEACMRGVVSALIEEPGVDAIILADLYEREYRKANIAALEELARTYDECRQWPFRYLTDDGCKSCEAERRKQLEQIVAELPSSPAKALADLTHAMDDAKSWAKYGAKKCMDCRGQFIERSLKPMFQTLKQVKLARGKGHGRDCYGKTLRPLIKPHFSTSRILIDAPTEAKLVDAYSLGDSEVRLYRLPNKLQHLYFLIPPEYKLRSEQVTLLNRARELLLERGMEKLDLSDAKHSRESFERLSSRLMTQLVIEGKSEHTKDEIEQLAKCLTKFSVGFGVLETLLSDERVQDIYIDAPIGRSPVHIYHGEHEECLTNIYLSAEDIESIISRFRAISGRPFSEADPVLDLNLTEFGARVAAIGPPLSPEGLALAIRRHKLTPWTLPQFVRNRFLTSEAAGLLSLLVDSQASILIAGSRGAGKTSLLGALMLEILQKYRIISIEDTAELPITQLRALGFKVQSLRVQSAVGRSETEMRAEDALRAALRLGESVLVIGEVRGPETKTLYEAMRIGAAGNSVMGTIHGATTRDVFDRVVYDLNIPPTSFKATDAIVVSAPIRSSGSASRTRRVVQITEIGKDWKDDPINEGGFIDLMKYDAIKDKLEQTPYLAKSQLIANIAKKWGTKPVEIIKNLELRTKIHKTLAETAVNTKNQKLLEAEFVARSNNMLHALLEEELDRKRTVDYGKIFEDWRRWLEEETKGEGRRSLREILQSRE